MRRRSGRIEVTNVSTLRTPSRQRRSATSRAIRGAYSASSASVRSTTTAPSASSVAVSLTSNPSLTIQQAFILAGRSYAKDDELIAEQCDTTIETIRSQRTQLQLSQLDLETATEVWKTPVPNVPFRKVGGVDYFLTDEWPREGNGGSCEIYYSVKPTDNYVAVIEESTVTDESEHIESEEFVWAVSEDRRRTTIYPSFEDFREESTYSPQNLSSSEAETSGLLFE